MRFNQSLGWRLNRSLKRTRLQRIPLKLTASNPMIGILTQRTFRARPRRTFVLVHYTLHFTAPSRTRKRAWTRTVTDVLTSGQRGSVL